MMKVSTKSSYGIRALADVGRQPEGTPVQLATIAERQNIPLPFLEQIFSKLRRAGLVESVRGPRGGYKLAKPPKKISFADIITALEGPLESIICITPENKSAHCHDKGGCDNRHVCNEVEGSFTEILTHNTLDSLLRQPSHHH